MAQKDKYAGKFNLNRETFEETAEAYTLAQAKYWMAHQLALRLGTIPQAIWGYWRTNPNSYEIKKVTHAQHHPGH